jgi:hypothetical protein
MGFSAGGLVMFGQFMHVVVRVLAGPVLGAAVGAFYGGLAGTAHGLAHGRWGQVPAFVAGCALFGAALGLLGGVAFAHWSGAARRKRNCRSPARDSGYPGPARGTVDEEETGRGRPPDRAGHLPAGDGQPVCPDWLARLYRTFATQN